MKWKNIDYRKSRAGVTLVEILVVITIIGILVALSIGAIALCIPHANCARCASNMHNLAIAFNSFAQDNNGSLPGRTQTGGGDKWPLLLLSYVNNDPSVYIDPSDNVANKIPLKNLLVNSPNNSSYIFNGFNDIGAYSNPSAAVNLATITNPSALCILGVQKPGGNNFYMDLQDGDQNVVLEKTEYFGGSNYAFADQSVQYIKSTAYTDNMWIVNQNYVIPSTH